MTTPLPSKFRVGRRNPATHRLDFAFYIERTDAGGLRITQIAHKLSDSERHLLLSHFGRPIAGVTGGLEEGVRESHVTREEPGTPVHFMRGCNTLPAPFSTMSENYEKYLR